jgi:hypothetical protein
MGQILRHWREVTAIFFSAVLIVGAFLLAHGVESPSIAQASTETALLQAIATKDSDNDGLPDWEEALYGTDPHLTDTFHLGMTDGAAVAKGLVVPKAIADIPVATSSPLSLSSEDSLPPAPGDGTLTAAFAKSFFSLYLAAKQNAGDADLTNADLQNVADQALSSLSSTIVAAPDFKSMGDLEVFGSGPDALKAFAVSAEAVLVKNTSNASTSELNYLKRALEDNDVSAYTAIASIAKAYRDSAVGLAILPVPKELASDDLILVNSMMRIGQIASDFARADTDPLATILALKQYPDAAIALGKAFIDIGKVYKTAGISLPAGAPGASFVNLIDDVTARQKAAAPAP